MQVTSHDTGSTAQEEVEKANAKLAADPENVEAGPESAKPKPGEHAEVSSLVKLAFDKLMELNAKVPCGENLQAAKALTLAMDWLEKRKADRKVRGVLGTDKP